MGLVDLDCRTDNSAQRLQGEREEKVSVASQHSVTGAGVCVCVCLCAALSAEINYLR